jgi:hypothetical protein
VPSETVTAPRLQIRSPDAEEITSIPKLVPFTTLGSWANRIEVAIFPDTEGVGVAFGDALGDDVTFEEAVVALEVAAAVVGAFVLVCELDP